MIVNIATELSIAGYVNVTLGYITNNQEAIGVNCYSSTDEGTFRQTEFVQIFIRIPKTSTSNYSTLRTRAKDIERLLSTKCGTTKNNYVDVGYNQSLNCLEGSLNLIVRYEN